MFGLDFLKRLKGLLSIIFLPHPDNSIDNEYQEDYQRLNECSDPHLATLITVIPSQDK
ncbi:hypothetical protein HPP92_014992 [Vanilla planifolia]|uniref:Uncharacterized protein n=1 Tax=Vanilla planifolia TaxID=51239 RepID=A0A835QQL7_VANPL|nr:hypothetical protein HPP92_014992 [Vanilla planifolia]